jgi:hypothetical protein
MLLTGAQCLKDQERLTTVRCCWLHRECRSVDVSMTDLLRHLSDGLDADASIGLQDIQTAVSPLANLRIQIRWPQPKKPG